MSPHRSVLLTGITYSLVCIPKHGQSQSGRMGAYHGGVDKSASLCIVLALCKWSESTYDAFLLPFCTLLPV